MNNRPETPDYVTAPPQPDEAMFHGFIGDVAYAATEGSEVNRVAVVIATLTEIAAAVGRYHHVTIGDVRHPLVIYALHVGRSGIAGKGEATALPRKIRDRANDIMGDIGVSSSPFGEEALPVTPFTGSQHSGGLSTGEGLALMIHDGFSSKDGDQPPVSDKRLLVSEPEFARLLEVGRRQGNPISAVIRDLWDGGDIAPATKQARVTATDPHIVIRGAITPSELRQFSRGGITTNGFLNRFFVFHAEREREVPFPQGTPDDVVETLARDFIQVVKFGAGTYPAEKDVVQMRLSPAAKALYAEVYGSLRETDGMSEIEQSLLERRAPMVWRIAALYAITDQSNTIEVVHLEAALALAKYHRESIAFLFSGDERSRELAAKKAEREQRILSFLEHANAPVNRTDIIRDCFSGHIRKPDLSDALESLLLDGRIEQEEVPKANGSGKAKHYRLKAGGQPNNPEAGDTEGCTNTHASNPANEANDENHGKRPASHRSHLSHHSHHWNNGEQTFESDVPEEQEEQAGEVLQGQPEPRGSTPSAGQVIH